ncbi:MAG TPA: thioesterase family protein [Bacteroidales bacterium]|nr:thioesterase family protein [Bacteroidales bacterium]
MCDVNFNIPIGIVGREELIVSNNDTASKYGSGLIDVLATPAMIGLMEKTAMNSINTFLPNDYITLGIEVNVSHIKATPVGMKVFSESKLIKVVGKKLFFEVNAWDENGQIGFGNHTRYIVNKLKFIEKLKKG